MQFISHVINQICSLLYNSDVDTATTIITIIQAAGTDFLYFKILIWRFGNYEDNTTVEKCYIGH